MMAMPRKTGDVAAPPSAGLQLTSKHSHCHFCCSAACQSGVSNSLVYGPWTLMTFTLSRHVSVIQKGHSLHLASRSCITRCICAVTALTLSANNRARYMKMCSQRLFMTLS